jgi:hypothetical protein
MIKEGNDVPIKVLEFGGGPGSPWGLARVNALFQMLKNLPPDPRADRGDG